METIIKICSENFRYLSCFALNVVLSRCSLHINITERFMNFKPFVNFKDGGGDLLLFVISRKEAIPPWLRKHAEKQFWEHDFLLKETFTCSHTSHVTRYCYFHRVLRLWINRYRMIFCDLSLSSQVWAHTGTTLPGHDLPVRQCFLTLALWRLDRSWL